MKNIELEQAKSPFKLISKIAAGVALALAASSSVAVEYETDNFDISFDTTLSLGASWRVEDQDPNLIGKANLYQLRTGRSITEMYASCTANPACTVPEGAWSNNSDDGNLNFDKGDMFSNVIKGLHELDVRHKDGDVGLFARGLWYYDRVLMDGNLPFRDLDSYPPGGYAAGANTARTEQGYDVEMLDLYAWASWDVGEASTLQVRLGEQVVSWGESTFIQHSLNEANAVNLRTLRNPGAELKEALIPSGMLWASMDLTDQISVEGFYQYEWEPVKVDEPGTYFATRDFLGFTGSDVHLGFAQVPEGTPRTIARRTQTRDADDQGQYGLKLAYFTEGGTEFGLYYMNYHNRRPLISAVSADSTTFEISGFLEYPEDIQMAGLSFNTATDGGWSVAGEVSYRMDEPLQVDDVELLFAALEPLDGLSAPGPVFRGTSQVANTVGFGEEISGYRLLDTAQAQATFTKLLGSLFGSTQTVFLLEVGANQIIDMPSQDELRFEAEGTFRSGSADRVYDQNLNGVGDGSFSAAPIGVITPCSFFSEAAGRRIFTECEGQETNGFADDFSWGYRLAMRWNYDNAFAGWNLAPRIVFQHDVDGNTPAPISNFLEGRKALSLGLSFDYQSTYKIDFGYNRFFGNESANLIHDRDYVSLAFSYSI